MPEFTPPFKNINMEVWLILKVTKCHHSEILKLALECDISPLLWFQFHRTIKGGGSFSASQISAFTPVISLYLIIMSSQHRLMRYVAAAFQPKKLHFLKKIYLIRDDTIMSSSKITKLILWFGLNKITSKFLTKYFHP